jgi:hypothetical protein
MFSGRQFCLEAHPEIGLRQLACAGAMLLAPFLSIGTGNAAVIADSVPFARAGETCNDSPLVAHRCETPGTSSAWDFETDDGFIEVASAAASPFGPVASVVGQSDGGVDHLPFARTFAAAEVDWTVIVTPIGPGLGLPPTQVPVNLQGSVEALAQGQTAAAIAEVTSPFGVLLFCQAVGAGNSGFCAGIDNDSGITTLTGSVAPNLPISLAVTAQGGAVGDSDFQASADPIFSVADALIPGTDINFRDAFVVTFSPDVTQTLGPGIVSVPEPGAMPLLAAGFLVMSILWGRRRKDFSGRMELGARPLLRGLPPCGYAPGPRRRVP